MQNVKPIHLVAQVPLKMPVLVRYQQALRDAILHSVKYGNYRFDDNFEGGAFFDVEFKPAGIDIKCSDKITAVFVEQGREDTNLEGYFSGIVLSGCEEVDGLAISGIFSEDMVLKILCERVKQSLLPVTGEKTDEICDALDSILRDKGVFKGNGMGII